MEQDLDKVIEKLERYAKHLENEVVKKSEEDKWKQVTLI